MTVRLLLVDDDDLVRTALKMILESEPEFEIVGEASNGVEALPMADTLNPDVILMDIQMPEMDGIEATRAIIRHDPDAVIIMCSALGQEALVIESLAAGARDFIVKPFTPEKVLRMVHGVLEH